MMRKHGTTHDISAEACRVQGIFGAFETGFFPGYVHRSGERDTYLCPRSSRVCLRFNNRGNCSAPPWWNGKDTQAIVLHHSAAGPDKYLLL